MCQRVAFRQVCTTAKSRKQYICLPKQIMNIHETPINKHYRTNVINPFGITNKTVENAHIYGVSVLCAIFAGKCERTKSGIIGHIRTRYLPKLYPNETLGKKLKNYENNNSSCV